MNNKNNLLAFYNTLTHNYVLEEKSILTKTKYTLLTVDNQMQRSTKPYGMLVGIFDAINKDS